MSHQAVPPGAGATTAGSSVVDAATRSTIARVPQPTAAATVESLGDDGRDVPTSSTSRVPVEGSEVRRGRRAGRSRRSPAGSGRISGAWCRRSSQVEQHSRGSGASHVGAVGTVFEKALVAEGLEPLPRRLHLSPPARQRPPDSAPQGAFVRHHRGVHVEPPVDEDEGRLEPAIAPGPRLPERPTAGRRCALPTAHDSIIGQRGLVVSGTQRARGQARRGGDRDTGRSGPARSPT